VKVLVFGAGGYIGFAAAVALRREGHKVTGVVRNEKARLLLAQNEVYPVTGDLKDLKSLQSHIESATVVVDTTSNHDYELSYNLLALVRESAKKSGVPKRLVYTSGVLDYGHHEEPVDETYSVNKSPRNDFSKALISDKEVEGVILRPGWVYGGNSGKYITGWFEHNQKGEIEIVGNPDKKWSWVHIQDLADAYVKVVGASKGLVTGEIFDVADDTRVTFGQLRLAFAKAAGLEGKVVYTPAGTDAWSKLSEVTALVTAAKIKRVLGWQPKHGTLFDDLDLYYLAYRAEHPKQSSSSSS